ncbi:MAG: helix-turn-helix transcriptional regulator [Treponema sp.]|nr:helix-turn-helix transcriptional regulator [Treponema sp.]
MTLKEQEEYVCHRLRQEREKRGMSQMDLSLESGLSQNMITYIETNKRTPTISSILKLCSALDIDPSILFPKTDGDKEKAKQQVLDLIQRYM